MVQLWHNIYLKHEKNIRNMRSLWGVCESFWLVVLWWIFEFFKIFWQTFLYENFLIRIIWQTFYILRNNIFVETIFKWWSYSYVNWIMTLRPRISMSVPGCWICVNISCNFLPSILLEVLHPLGILSSLTFL